MNESHGRAPTDGEARLRALLDVLAAGDGRIGADVSSARPLPELAGITVRDLDFRGPHGAIPGRTYRGTTTPMAGLVWVHGGAFIAGDLDMAEAHWVALQLAARGIAVLSLDYRKALGGVHHPVPSDDVLAGWLAATSDQDLLAVPVEQLHLGGASAGANLAGCVARRLVAGAGPLPASLVLVYPILHPEIPEPSPEAAAAAVGVPEALRFDPDFIQAINVNYVGTVAALADPLAFAAAGDLHGMPRTYVLTAEADDLRPSGEQFARDLTSAEVSVLLEVEPGTVHGYLDDPSLPAAARTIDRLTRWLAAGR